jgi:hypothetical protein
MKVPRLPWQVNAGMATLCAGVAGVDVVTHQWWGVPLMAASGGINVVIGRYNHQQQSRQRRHDQEARRPDYARIARLELELGLVEPPPKPKPLKVTSPVGVNASLTRIAVKGGALMYVGVPTYGNPPIEWLGTCQVDPFGNLNPGWRHPPPVIAAPDGHCGLCFPGGPPPGHSCPFYPVCQKS